MSFSKPNGKDFEFTGGELFSDAEGSSNGFNRAGISATTKSHNVGAGGTSVNTSRPSQFRVASKSGSTLTSSSFATPPERPLHLPAGSFPQYLNQAIEQTPGGWQSSSNGSSSEPGDAPRAKTRTAPKTSKNGSRRSKQDPPVSPFSHGPFEPLGFSPLISNSSRSSLESAASSYHSWDGEEDRSVTALFSGDPKRSQWHDIPDTSNTYPNDLEAEDIILKYGGLTKADFLAIQEMLVGAAITRTTSPSKHRSPLLRRRRPTNHSLNDGIGRPPPPPPSTSDQYSALLNSVVESLLQSSPRSRQKQSVGTTINDAESYNGSPTTRRNRDPAQVLFGENSLPSNDPTVSVHPISPLVPPSAASATGPYQLSRNPPTSRLPQSTQERAELEREVQRKAEAAMVALQKQPSGSNMVLAPKASAWGRRRISPSQISTPQLVSASTSIDTIPLLTRADTQDRAPSLRKRSGLGLGLFSGMRLQLARSRPDDNSTLLNSMSPVDAIVYNHDRRAALLTQGLSTSDRRNALDACYQRICTSLLTVLDSRDTKRAVLLLEGDRAQSFLDAIQDVLDKGSLPSARHTSQARRLILRLSEAHDQLPSSLFITGVIDYDDHPTFCGGFGDIYRASHNGSTVAVKRIRMFNASTESQRARVQFCREALVWQRLQHKYVLPLIGIDRESFPSSFCMVSPWMKHGTVLKYLIEHGRDDVDKLLLQVAEGLGYLHSMNIVHGDLRGTNILVSDDWTACLADFGLTTIIDAASTSSAALTSSTNPAGSARWFAPELIQPTSFGCKRFTRTPATDVYAYACVCLEFYTGRPPFSGVSPDVAAMLKVIAGDRPARPDSTMSDALWNLVTVAWAQNFRDRPNIKAIIEYMRVLNG